MGRSVTGSKVLVEIGSSGSSALLESIRNFEKSECISGYVVACRIQDQGRIVEQLADLEISTPVIFAEGGDTRKDSVYSAIVKLPKNVEYVAVHDAARAFCSPDSIREVVRAAKSHGAAILATRSKSTLKKVDPSTNSITQTLERGEVWNAQTPQVFNRQLIESVYRQAKDTGFVGTDESQLVEHFGHSVQIVEGADTNFKLTTPEDLLYAEWLIARRT